MFFGTCLIGLLHGCADTYEVAGRQVTIEADAELEMCAGSAEHMDRFVERLGQEFGLPLTGAPWIDYRWMTAARLERRNPCGGRPACAVLHSVVTSTVPHDHELVHAIVSDLGLAHPFFLEGLAMAYEDGEHDGDDDADSAGSDVLSVLRRRHGQFPSDDYVLAGNFTRYLIDRFGLARHLEFYRRTWYRDSYRSLVRTFNNVFGAELEQVAGDFAAERGDCGYTGARFKLLSCEQPALAWDGQRLARNIPLDCADPAAIGTPGEFRVMHTLVVPAGGRYRIEARAEETVNIALGSCGGCERQVYAAVDGGEGMAEVELPAGRYFLKVVSRSPAPSTAGLLITRIGGSDG